MKKGESERRRVAIAAGGGMRHEDIAIGLGISVAQLKEKFQHELSIGAHRKRMDVMGSLYREAINGNVTAARTYMANEARTSAPPLPAEFRKPVVAPAVKEPKPPKLGKKEQAHVDAQTAEIGTEWEDLLKPRGSLN